MIFNGTEGQSVELSLLGYEYPNDKDEWLNIHFKVRSKIGDWECTHPCITKPEFVSLITSFEKLSISLKTKYEQWFFTELVLVFEFFETNTSEDQIKFRIVFDTRPHPTIGGSCFVDCVADRKEFKRLASELKKELDQLPHA
jgi:hypothetical protein